MADATRSLVLNSRSPFQSPVAVADETVPDRVRSDRIHAVRPDESGHYGRAYGILLGKLSVLTELKKTVLALLTS